MTDRVSYLIVDNRLGKEEVQIIKSYKDVLGHELENQTGRDLHFEIHVTDGKVDKVVVK